MSWCLQRIAWGGEAAEAQSSWLLVTLFSESLVLSSQHLSAFSSVGSCRKGSDFPLLCHACLLLLFLAVSGEMVWLASPTLRQECKICEI